MISRSSRTGAGTSVLQRLALTCALAIFALTLLPLMGSLAHQLTGVSASGVALAQAQPNAPKKPNADQVAQAAEEAEDPHGLSDAALNKSRSAAMIFWLFAFAIIAGSIFVITRRNLVTAVMGMVGTFFAIAAVYAMLYAHFLTAMQVLVYAGAIMVLFVFVIMILNKPEAEPWSAGTHLPGKIIVIGAILYLVVRLIMVLWGIEAPDGSAEKPAQLALQSGELADFGSTKALGHTLFRDYLFPFEAVSLVLLIAVVGAVAVARPHERRPGALSEGVAGDLGGAEGHEAK